MNYLRLDWVPRGVLFKWLLMAFLAGHVNAGGFMACARFVTHVTGFATLFGVEAADGRWFAALGMLSVPAYFLVGCMVAAYLTEVQVVRGRRPRFGLVMTFVSALLALVAVMGHFGLFSDFGTFVLERDYVFLVILSSASGLQNAAISVATRGVLRATHLTGITTDLGIGIMRALFGKRSREQRLREFQQSWLRMSVIVAFGIGSVVGAVAFLKFDYGGFVLPAAVALYCANLGVRAGGILMPAAREGGLDAKGSL